MDLKLALHGTDGVRDVLIGLDPSVTVGELAERVRATDPDRTVPLPLGSASRPEPVTLAIGTPDGGWRGLAPVDPVADSALRSGLAVTVVPVGQGPTAGAEDGVVAVLSVIAGPDAGREFPLRAGETVIGRGATAGVALIDQLVSKRHARLRIGTEVRLNDLNSANGTTVDGDDGGTARLTAHSRVSLGDSLFQVRLLRPGTQGQPERPEAAFNRPPRVEPVFTGRHEEIPAPPQRSGSQPLPFFSVLLPLVMALVIYQVTGSGLAAAFLSMTSLLMIGVYAEQRLFRRRDHRRALATFRARLAEQRGRFTEALEHEGHARRFEHPSAADVRTAIVERTPMLWSRRPGEPGFGQARLGCATLPSRSRLMAPSRDGGDPSLGIELERLTAEFAVVRDVPVPVDLPEAGALGICGPEGARHDAARALVLQLVGLHSPQDLIVAALGPPSAQRHWSWLRWLPHLAPAARFGGTGLGADPDSGRRILTAAELLVQQRTRGAAGGLGRNRDGAASRLPLLLLVVEDDAALDRARLVELAERGGPAGVHLLWSTTQVRRLPAPCRSYLQVTEDGAALIGHVASAELITPVRAESLAAATAEALARLLAPVVDGGTAPDRQADLPTTALLVEHARDLLDVPAAIAERWQETDSTGPLAGAGRRPAGTLRAVVGQGAEAPFHLDLREHGPHALVGGTTGSGKSEFLQSWLLGLALDHGPQRVTFLLVDYKGGAAFAEVVRLPHTVGLVTDLTPRLVRRALTSLRAEVRHRERLLAAAGAADLLELERRGDPTAPPALVIVVDEFAALVQDVPEFVDGMIDIAQRGRSLGLHLILATQRPAGVIKDNLRANTNLRVALRMADADDSLDVLGCRDAALFDPAVPGRAMAATGPGRLTPFQALYAGGRTSIEPAPPAITVSSLGFGAATTWPVPEGTATTPGDGGPTDVHRVVDAVSTAARDTGVAPPRRPWLPELPAVVQLESLTAPGSPWDPAGADELVLGLGDDPGRQRRTVVTFRPDDDGALLVVGTGGCGKSTALRSLAVAAGSAARPWHVYGLDFGSRGLAALEPLPHVGSIVTSDDAERVTRLLDRLRAIVDERAVRYARADAATIERYRRLAGAPDEPRILLLIDNFAGFRSAYELSRSSRLYEMLPGLAVDGRSVGVHLALATGRPGDLPAGLAAAATKRLTLRLVQDVDLSAAGLTGDAFAADAPAGRGYLDGQEVQVAVLGADGDAAAQGECTRQLAEQLRRDGGPGHRPRFAPSVGRLAERVELSSLRPDVDGWPTLGVAEDTLVELGFAVGGTFLIAGPPQSGRTTALLTAARSVQRGRPEGRLVYFGAPHSPLTGSLGPAWERTAVAVEEAVALAAEVLAEWIPATAAPDICAVIENLPQFADTAAADPLERLIAALAVAGHTVLADGETTALTSSWGLPRAMKAARHGLLLQPDQTDGDSVLRTALPRLRRADFPPGRGVHVRSGRVRTVQVALPT